MPLGSANFTVPCERTLFKFKCKELFAGIMCGVINGCNTAVRSMLQNFKVRPPSNIQRLQCYRQLIRDYTSDYRCVSYLKYVKCCFQLRWNHILFGFFHSLLSITLLSTGHKDDEELKIYSNGKMK
jgi:hypothetical protein